MNNPHTKQTDKTKYRVNRVVAAYLAQSQKLAELRCTIPGRAKLVLAQLGVRELVRRADQAPKDVDGMYAPKNGESIFIPTDNESLL